MYLLLHIRLSLSPLPLTCAQATIPPYVAVSISFEDYQNEQMPDTIEQFVLQGEVALEAESQDAPRYIFVLEGHHSKSTEKDML